MGKKRKHNNIQKGRSKNNAAKIIRRLQLTPEELEEVNEEAKRRFGGGDPSCTVTQIKSLSCDYDYDAVGFCERCNRYHYARRN